MNRWMKIAHDEALSGMTANEGGPFGAVIVKNGELIASSHNKVLKSKDPTAHAEVNAIREASKALNSFDLSECTLYTTCMPCPMCLGAILWARIPVVYYGATQEDAAKGGFDDDRFYDILENRSDELKLQQMDQKENSSLFDSWLLKSDRKIY